MTSIDNQSARMLEERLALSSARIRELITETDIAEPFGEYFRKLAQFIVFSEEIRKKRLDGSFYALSEKELEKINRKLYEDVLPDEEQEMHYSVSYANPAYAAEKLGEEYGPLLSWIYMEVRALISLGARGETEDIAQILELFLQICFAFRAGEELPSPESIRKDIYWYVSDYADYTVPKHIREQLDPSLTFYKDIVMKFEPHAPTHLIAKPTILFPGCLLLFYISTHLICDIRSMLSPFIQLFINHGDWSL